MIELYKKIQHLRKQRGMTQDALAEALLVSRQTVYKWETGRALPDVNRLKQICELFSVSADELLEIYPVTDSKPRDESGNSQQLLPNETAHPKPHRRHALWLCIGAAAILLCACIAIVLARQPEELRQAQAMGVVPAGMTDRLSQPVTERELLALLSNVCEKEMGHIAPALANATASATNEQMTREKAAYWIYCTHIWAKIDPDAALSVETDTPLVSQRNVYEDLNTLSRSDADGKGAHWERSLCGELANADNLFARYDGTAEMDEQINAILYGPYYTSVAFCLAQKSFLNEKPLMDCDGDSFSPKNKITRTEAIIAAYRLYGSW